MSQLAKKRELIRQSVLEALKKGKVRKENLVAFSRKITLAELFEEKPANQVDGWSISELYDIVQGVTWGGLKCKDIYIVDKAIASTLESKLVYKTIGGADIKSYEIEWERKFLVFPYIKSKSKWIPAFKHTSLGGDDSLDFSLVVSEYEKEKDVLARLKYRIAKNLVRFPRTASYLTMHYDKLEQREFEGKRMSQYNKSWYEYHRPRTPQLITKPKIVGKRLMKTAAFAIDNTGYLPRDSVISLLPRKKLHEARSSFEKVLKQKFTLEDMFEFSLKFLNSKIFQDILKMRRSKKRGGYPIVGERLLSKLMLPRPNSKNMGKIKKILQGDSKNIDLRSLYRPSKKKQRTL